MKAYKYYAFISYSHEDKRWALRIQRELEAFRLPSVLQKSAKNLPERIRPIFLDASDLGVGKLREKLHEELEQSKYLIVVCSPRSAVPNAEGEHWVDSEVAHFAELGRENCIIPVIVEGTPQTAFCPSLKKVGILSLDATKTSRRRIISDIVAKILGLTPDELWRREQRRWRRKMVVRTLAISLQMFIVGCVIWYVVDWNREKVRYYKRSREVFGFQENNHGVASTGVAEGESQISRDELLQVDAACRFHYRGYDSWIPGSRKPLLRQIVSVDSSDETVVEKGEYLLHPSAAGRWYIYNERGLPTSIIIIGTDGRPVSVGNGVARIVNTFDGLGRLKEQTFYNPNHEQCLPNGFDFCRTVYKYVGNNANVVTNLTYATNGSWREFERNLDGRPVRVSFFNHDGTCAQDNLGIVSYSCTYDERGNEVRREFFDGTGARKLSTEHIAGWNSKFDSSSNEIERSFFGLENELKEDENGIAIIKYKYDPNNSRIAKDVYDRNNKRTTDNTGIAGIRWECDDSGRVIAEWRINRKEAIVPDEAGVEIARYTLDDSGNIIERRFYSADNTPKRSIEEIGGWKSKFDTKRHEKERRFIDEKGNYCRGKDGTGGWRYEYDEIGRPVRVITIDENGDPIAIGMDVGGGVQFGVVEMRCRYLFGGRCVNIAVLNDESAKMLGAKYIACTKGLNGRVERYDMMNDAGITKCSFGWATKRAAFNGMGEITEQSYWNDKNEPATSTSDGIHKNVLSYRRNETGLTVDIRCFDTNGFLAVSKELGFAWAVKRYDQQGRLLSAKTFDENRKAICTQTLPASNVEIRYDSQGRMSRISVVGEKQSVDIGLEYPQDVSGEIRLIEFAPDGTENRRKNVNRDDPSFVHLVRLGNLRYALDVNGAPVDVERSKE